MIGLNPARNSTTTQKIYSTLKPPRVSNKGYFERERKGGRKREREREGKRERSFSCLPIALQLQQFRCLKKSTIEVVEFLLRLHSGECICPCLKLGTFERTPLLLRSDLGLLEKVVMLI